MSSNSVADFVPEQRDELSFVIHPRNNASRDVDEPAHTRERIDFAAVDEAEHELIRKPRRGPRNANANILDVSGEVRIGMRAAEALQRLLVAPHAEHTFLKRTDEHALRLRGRRRERSGTRG